MDEVLTFWFRALSRQALCSCFPVDLVLYAASDFPSGAKRRKGNPYSCLARIAHKDRPHQSVTNYQNLRAFNKPLAMVFYPLTYHGQADYLTAISHNLNNITQAWSIRVRAQICLIGNVVIRIITKMMF